MKNQIYELKPLFIVNDPIYIDGIKGPESAARLAFRYYLEKGFDPNKEHATAALLSQAHKILAFHHISTGSLTSSILEPREVYKPAIVHSAAAVIVFHNHPSGQMKASAADRKISKILREAGEILNIPLLDSIILDLSTPGRYLSLREAGEMEA